MIGMHGQFKIHALRTWSDMRSISVHSLGECKTADPVAKHRASIPRDLDSSRQAKDFIIDKLVKQELLIEKSIYPGDEPLLHFKDSDLEAIDKAMREAGFEDADTE